MAAAYARVRWILLPHADREVHLCAGIQHLRSKLHGYIGGRGEKYERKIFGFDRFGCTGPAGGLSGSDRLRGLVGVLAMFQ